MILGQANGVDYWLPVLISAATAIAVVALGQLLQRRDSRSQRLLDDKRSAYAAYLQGLHERQRTHEDFERADAAAQEAFTKLGIDPSFLDDPEADLRRLSVPQLSAAEQLRLVRQIEEATRLADASAQAHLRGREAYFELLLVASREVMLLALWPDDEDVRGPHAVQADLVLAMRRDLGYPPVRPE